MNAEPEKDLAEYRQDASESEPDLETENLRVEREDFEKDRALSDEAEAFSDALADERTSDESTDAAIESRDIPDRPPEETVEPPEAVEEIAAGVIEDPLLAYDLEPELLQDVETLLADLAEEVEPEELLELGY